MARVFSFIIVLISWFTLYAEQSPCEIFRDRPDQIKTWGGPSNNWAHMALDFPDTMVIDSIVILADTAVYPIKGIRFNHARFNNQFDCSTFAYIKPNDPVYWDNNFEYFWCNAPLTIGAYSLAAFFDLSVIADTLRIKPSTPDTLKIDLVFFATFVNKTGPGGVVRCRSTDTLHIAALRTPPGTSFVRQHALVKTGKKPGLKKRLSSGVGLIISNDNKSFSPDGRVFSLKNRTKSSDSSLQ